MILRGDCAERLRELDDASIDAVVTDPPYGLSAEPDIAEVLTHWLAGDDYVHKGGGFMGNTWDSFVPGPSVWKEVARVLKPGGHALIFAGTRTVDLMAIAVRLGGLQIRDQLTWMYASGFPKSHNVSKAIDRQAGAEGEVLSTEHRQGRSGGILGEAVDIERHVRAPATEEARRWQGWGTALKPAYEPIILARKPLQGTIADNVLAHGTGALNIDGSRIGWGDEGDKSAERKDAGYSDAARKALGSRNDNGTGFTGEVDGTDSEHGRFPANVILDEAAGELLDEQSGERPAGTVVRRNVEQGAVDPSNPTWSLPNMGGPDFTYGDTGGASRFFFCPKASTGERDAGLDHLDAKDVHRYGAGVGAEGAGETGGSLTRNIHPTVKPIDLMRYLIKLITPPGGTVLDPFTGSGTTGCAAAILGTPFIGCEMSDEYADIAEARIRWWAEMPPDVEIPKALATANAERKIAETGQMGLLG